MDRKVAGKVAGKVRRSILCMAVAGAATAVLPAMAAPATHTVVIEGMRFAPQALTVHRGDRIVWRNKDLVPHTATAAHVFDSGSIAPGDSWARVADKTGTVSYVCTFHPTMKGTVTVE